ncbi:ROK family protein [Helcococcus sueciensis]|uniref:ROK family protein n=1 Tax=Helcococcus sueciensis TaxID=241555 RepID=UPI000421A6EB|nr:ROK family protein [Helcococcus sueciensis]
MYTIGVDVGGTSARVALLDENFNIVKKETISTGKRDFEIVIKEIADLINNIDPDRKALLVGFDTPGPLDLEKGMILDAPNLPTWSNKPFVNKIEELTGRKTYLTNDANAAALAQAIEDKSETLVFITVSTGVGGGIVYQGKLMEGKKAYAGEFGLMIISDDDRHHEQLYKGTLESLCSGTALSLEASKRYNREVSTKELFDLYEDKDSIAIEIIDLWVEHFSRAIANLLQIIEPEVFYIGGSVVLFNPWLLDMVKEKTKNKLYEGLKDRVNLKIARYGEDAGIVGAAYNAFVNSKEIV